LDARRTRFDRLLLPHLGAAYQLARWVTGDAELARDAVQEGCLRAWQALGRGDPERPRAWLLTIVRHAAYRLAERRGRGGTIVPFDEHLHASYGTPPEPPDRLAQRRAEARLVRDALAGLPDAFRDALVLRELEGLDYAEIAAVTGVPVGTVMSRLARGRARLKKLLEARVEPRDRHGL
jgi:RNA polymerase sigma-70 factor (ECF subfamily)